MSDQKHLFFLMNHFFYGFVASLMFGLLSSAAVYYFEPIEIFHRFHHAFFISFNCFISGGFMIGAALLVHKMQTYIPATIENTFPSGVREKADSIKKKEDTYVENRNRYYSAQRSATFTTQFVIIGFAIFYFAKFPLDGFPEYILITYGCMQYALGVYIGRKLFYIAQMLNAIKDIEVDGTLFKQDKLAGVLTYVNTISTMTIVVVYMHVASYYKAPFIFDSLAKESIKVALLLPAIIATPVVVLFNFYPRYVFKEMYLRSIAIEIESLKKRYNDNELSPFERMSYIVEHDRLLKDELKHRLRLTLSDLPIGITIFVAVIALLK
jgi:hypothetical protein